MCPGPELGSNFDDWNRSAILKEVPATQPSFTDVEVVLLDRDGVVNRKLPEGEYVSSWERFDLLPGVPEAIKSLNDRGITSILLTNQRGIALGLYSEKELAGIHDRLQKVLAETGAHLDAIYFCPHDKGQCSCRKPGTGLLEQAFADFPQATRTNTVLIGDSLSDIQAGKTFGIRTIFIQGDERYRKAGADNAASLADANVASLPDAVALVAR
jgi:D-glycero-D-manno-heptose 1,7-bisphosphate phosphatase